MARLIEARLRPQWTVGPREILVGSALAGALLGVAVVKQPGAYRALLGLAELGLLAAIAVQDLRTMRAPNRIVYPALAFALLAALTLGGDDAREAWLGGVVTFVVLLVAALLGRGAMGMGDVKAGALCGVVVGISGVLPMLALAFIGGGALALALLAARARGLKDSIPFTPLLAGATAASMMLYPLYLWS
jgi:prepilin signal peptidase PulO-like enzyme (type II secretory pathway)